MIVDLVLNDAKAYLAGEVKECSIAVEEGKIIKIGMGPHMPQADHKTSLEHFLVLPGLIDGHVHLRDEEKSYKEDFYTGTAAAAAGGITTVLDMPNNNPVTMSVESLRNRINRAQARILVNVGFYSEFPTENEEIGKIANEGAVGFKLFMTEQVGGLDPDNNSVLLEAFKLLSELRRKVAVHAEDRTELKNVKERLKSSKRDDMDAFIRVHSERAEVKAVERILGLAERSRASVHFCHISTENGMNKIVEAKRSGLSVTCEATPHHLLLSLDDLKRIGTLALTMPPLRTRNHSEALWMEIRNGSVDVIGSDHAPHAVEEKDAESVWNVKVGIPGLETTLPLLLTEVKQGKLSIGDIAKLMAEKPAEIFNLKSKGFLRTGYDADLTVVDLKTKSLIEASTFKSKAKFSPFDGRLVVGKPVKTYVHGVLVLDEAEIVAKAGTGEVVRGA